MIDLWSYYLASQRTYSQQFSIDYPDYVVIWHVAGGIASLGDNCARFWLCTFIRATFTALNGRNYYVEALGSQRSTGIARLVPQLAHPSCNTSHHELW